MLAHHYLQALELTAATGGDAGSFAGAARLALADAGDRAFALHAGESAVRFFRAALDLYGEAGAERGRLLLRLGTALPDVGDPDAGVLEQARDELLAAGDVEGGVEAETKLAELHWTAGDSDRAIEHLGKARRLAEPLPPSAAKARAVSMASRITMLAGDNREAIRIGEEALTMAAAIGLVEVRAATLNNVGSARANLGEEKGLDQMAEAIEVARAANAPFEICRAIGNLAAHYWALGRLREAEALWRESLQEARGYGQQGLARWDYGILLDVDYELGRWDEASAAADVFLGEVEGGSPHYLAAQCYMVRADIRLGRGSVELSLEDAARALELARRAKDPQLFYPVLARAANVLREAGDLAAAVSLAEECVGVLESGQSLGFGGVGMHVLAWTLEAAGRGLELAEALSGYPTIPWTRAGAAFGRGDSAGAADICSELGAVTQEAYARLAAARQLVEAGTRREADEQLQRALAFYRSVGATRYVRQGETLLAASA
jgi:tetratricopeptide (TPR) repeat protein